MNRNLSTLEFQRRLIRSAMQSPRAECLRLLGIVYSNLEEFVTDRLPYDLDIDTTVDHLNECYQLLEAAVARRFTNLYVENLPENWETALDLLYGELDIDTDDTLEETEKLRKQYEKELADFPQVPALFVTGNKCVSQAFVRLSLAPHEGSPSDDDIAEKLATYCSYTITAEGVRLRHTIRKINGPTEGADRISKAYVDATNSGRVRNVTVRYMLATRRRSGQYPRTFATDSNIIHSSMPCSNIRKANSFVYTVEFNNPIMFHFDRLARMIEKRFAGKGGFMVFKYEPDTVGLQSFRGTISPRTGNYTSANPYDPMSAHTTDTEFYRGPFTDNFILYKLCEHLHLSAEAIDKCKSIPELEEHAESIRSATQGGPLELENVFMTIYRTDPLGYLSGSFNLKFIFFIAALCKERAHIMIECRAHRDESNNIALYQALSKYGVDIRAGAAFVGNRGFAEPTPKPWTKVHAKVWAFCFKQPDRRCMGCGPVVELFSTGNFTSVAQQGFVDSYIIAHSTNGAMASGSLWAEIFGSDSVQFENGPTRAAVPGVHSVKPSKVTFHRGQIRRTLLYKIHNAQRNIGMPLMKGTMLRNGEKPVIIIKVNHITDKEIINALIYAADAGVEVYVTARTTSLIPLSAGIPNMHVNTVCGKYLEHDRWFIFGTITARGVLRATDVYLSSADLMPRNLDERLEFMYKVDVSEQNWLTANMIWQYCQLESIPECGYFNYDLRP